MYICVACSQRSVRQSTKWLRTTTTRVWRGWRVCRWRQQSLPCPAERRRRGSASLVTRPPSATHLSRRDLLPSCHTPAWPWRLRTSCISRYATKVYCIHRTSLSIWFRLHIRIHCLNVVYHWTKIICILYLFSAIKWYYTAELVIWSL